jgi:hypothetical protein
METDGDLSFHNSSNSVVSLFLTGNLPGVLRERQKEQVLYKSNSELELLFLRLFLQPKSSPSIFDETPPEASNNAHLIYFKLLKQNVQKFGRNKSLNLSTEKSVETSYYRAFLSDDVQIMPNYFECLFNTQLMAIDRLNSYS